MKLRNKTKQILSTLFFFFLAGLFEIGGGYLVWLWLREKRGRLVGFMGGLVLFIYGVLPTFQPAHFGRVYAAYGGVFIVSSIIWGAIIDKKTPDRYEIIGALVTLIGVLVIFYTPR